MKTGSRVHPPEDVLRGGVVCELHFLPPEQMESIRQARSAYWQAYRVAEQLHYERNRAYQAKWKRRWRRRQRAAKMRDKASQARSAYIAAISAAVICLLLLVAQGRTCGRCSRRMQLEPNQELHCLYCGHTAYLDRDPVRPTSAEFRADSMAEAGIIAKAWKVPHIARKAS